MAEEVLYESLMGCSVSASLIFTLYFSASCTRDACKQPSEQRMSQWRTPLIKVAGRPVQLPSFVKSMSVKEQAQKQHFGAAL